jgi:hypothetical protein
VLDIDDQSWIDRWLEVQRLNCGSDPDEHSREEPHGTGAKGFIGIDTNCLFIFLRKDGPTSRQF